MKEIEMLFKPRHYQKDVLRAFFVEKKKRLLLVLHRRAGKDSVAFQICWIAAIQKKGLYLYLAPVISQANSIIWQGRAKDGTGFLDYIPKELVAKVNQSTMSIHLINGSIIRITGSNNYEALIGSNPMGIVYSEMQNSDVRAFNLLRPILAENNGWSIMTATPRGKHNILYDLYETNKNNPDWFVQVLTVKDTFLDDGTPVITDEQIDEERRAGMHESVIQQEFFCSFDAASRGNYYSDEMKFATEQGRIGTFPIDPNIVVDTSWDLGISDATSICLFQKDPKNGHVTVIYHFEESGRELAYFAFHLEKLREQLGFKRYGTHYFPHDIRNRELSSGLSRIETMRKCGIYPRIVGNHLIAERIQCVRAMLHKVSFNEPNTRHLVRSLSEYRSKWDDKNCISSGPVHDKYSHAADSFGYFAIGSLEHRDKEGLQVQKRYASFTP